MGYSRVAFTLGIKDANVSGTLTVAGNSNGVAETGADAGKSLVAGESLVAGTGSADAVGTTLLVSAGSSSDTGKDEDAEVSVDAEEGIWDEATKFAVVNGSSDVVYVVTPIVFPCPSTFICWMMLIVCISSVTTGGMADSVTALLMLSA